MNIFRKLDFGFGPSLSSFSVLLETSEISNDSVLLLHEQLEENADCTSFGKRLRMSDSLEAETASQPGGDNS